MELVKIISIENATHDVMHIKTEKPQHISYLPGQAVDVAINKLDWKDELRPFTFISLPTDDFLEFFVKIYPDHQGVTAQIANLEVGDTLSIGEVFGDIQYKGEGIFIAGGAGITPFIAILKALKKQNKLENNKLIFANKTFADIIEMDYFDILLGKNFINVLSHENKAHCEHGYINKELIASQINNPDTYFYLCGPPPMMNAVLDQLKEIGIADSKIIREQF